MNVCTIIARNYLAHARVLGRSFLEHHPDGRFTVLVTDVDEAFLRGADEDFEVVGPYDIGIPEREFHRMALLYDVMELATAVKPWLLKTLLARDRGPVVYLDPDIEVFAPLDDISELAREHSIVLTPHTLSPLPHDRMEPGEGTLLRAGMFNLGFIAVGELSAPFLDWWAERLARAGHVDPGRGQFVDQRWVDYVPSLFEHAVLRDQACNVAHWNLETRRFEIVDRSYRVDGRPLRFFHFSGYDPKRPELLSKFLGPEPRILLSAHPALRQICMEYAERLFAAGYRVARLQDYRFDLLPSGIRLTPTMRRLYARELGRAEERDEAEPPNPFEDGEAAFLEWLNEPEHAPAPGVTRFLGALHAERPAVRAAFPDVRWIDRERYLEWALTKGRIEERIPPELLPHPPETIAETADEAVPGGVNVAGYLRAEAGIGQAARHVVHALEVADTPYSTFVYDKTRSRQSHAFTESSSKTYDINIICVNADQLLSFGHDVGPDFFRGRHSVGIWWWEVARFPEQFHGAFGIVGEVWVGSDFVRRAIAQETDKPVLTMPLGIELPDPAPTMSREELDLPESFLFLFSFDFDSRFERKNPLAVVEAFTRGFERGEGPVLLLKTINGDRNLRDLERLRFAIAERDDIILREGYLPPEQTAALTASCDCYVSLHRSEGFGLTIAEAMAHGKPVIATGYSGNLEYMTDEASCLVPYRLAPIPFGLDPYPAGTEWADPDVDAAAEYMRRLYEDPTAAEKLGRKAREHVAQVLSPSRTAHFLQSRLDELWAARSGGLESVRAASSGLQRASRYLSEGPSNSIRGPSRLGAVGVFLRRLVYRVLRPYTMRHAEFEGAVIDGLQELGDELVVRSRELEEAGRRERRRLTASVDSTIASHVEQLRGMADDVRARLDAFDRNVAGSANELRAALAHISAELTAQPFLAKPDLFIVRGSDGGAAMGYGSSGEKATPLYRGFEDIFRGTEEFIRERQRYYVDVLREHEPVLDVGCGRGELLDLLREAGIEATGVDADEGMVERCGEKGHRVELADANEYLAQQNDGSLGAIVALQVIEHLPYDRLVRFFELSRRKLVPDGVFVIETVNPHSIRALKAFWVDLTHEQPVFPEVALALSRLNGFESARVVFPNGQGDLERDRLEQGEYAVIATTSAGPARSGAEGEAGEPARGNR